MRYRLLNPNQPKEIKYIQYGTLTAEEWLQYSVAEIDKPSLKGSPHKDSHGTPYDRRLGVLERGKDNICLTCHADNMKCPSHFGHIVLPIPIFNIIYMTNIVQLLNKVCPMCAKPRILPKHAEMQGFMNDTKEETIKKFALKSAKVEFCPWIGECSRNLYMCKKCSCKHQSSKYLVCKDCGGCKRCQKVCKNCFECVKSNCSGCSKCRDCKGCGSPLSSFVYKDEEILQKFKDQDPIPFSAGEAYNVFIRISNEHLIMLGFNRHLTKIDAPYRIGNKTHPHQFRPESMIFTIFPVIPPRARPYVIRDGEKHDDDITDLLNTIIKCCCKLKSTDDDSSNQTRVRRRAVTSVSDREKIKDTLKKAVWSVIDNQTENSKLSSGGRAHKCLFTRIQGKKSRIQLNVGAKRTDFTARSVIVGAGTALGPAELGVPEYIAERQTKPQKVKQWNFDYLQQLVYDGKVACVLRNGDIKRLDNLDNERRCSFQLKIDDIVERHLQDGDYVMFNRQPTLRLESFISFKSKIFKDLYAWRLGLAYTTGFNADFDGDEMNEHIVQSYAASAEVAILMRSPVHIMTPQTNSPIAGLVQDGLTGGYILTNTWIDETSQDGVRCTMVDKDTVMDCIVKAKIPIDKFFDTLYRAKKLKFYKEYIYTDEVDNLTIKDEIPGKLFVSVLFPSNFCYEQTADLDKGMTVTIKITDGVMHPDSGPLFKKIIGGKSSSIIHQLWKEYSPEIASQFLTDAQLLIDYWFPSNGFSIGISDCITTSKEDITKELTYVKAAVTSMLQEEYTDKLESNINNELNSAMNIGPRTAKNKMNKGDRNALNIMRLSGAKGSTINLSGIAAFVGSQNIDAGRVPTYLSDGTRCLPTFEPGDNTPEARGFVFNSYMDGLTPEEVVFHAMAGREGIISTAVKTSDSGYIQKKVSKKLEDYSYRIDGTVRDANDRIMEFIYGDDGFDPKKLCYTKGGSFPFFINPVNIANRFNSDVRNRKNKKIKGDAIRHLKQDEIDVLLSFIIAGSPGIQTPVTELVTENTRTELSKLIKDVKIYESKIPEFCAEVRNIYESSKSQYGDMVGLIASLSIGEPTTQMTLNVFHLAGCGEKDVSVGVPRFKEIMNATNDPKKPTCTIYFNNELLIKNATKIKQLHKKNSKLLADNKIKEKSKLKKSAKYEETSNELKKECLEYLQSLKKQFESTYVSTFYLDYEMRYLPSDVNKKKGMSPLNLITYEEYSEEWWVKLSKELNETDITAESWVLILSFDLQKLYEKKITLKDIALAIENYSENNMKCIVSPNCIGKIEIYLNYSEIKQYVMDKLNIQQPSSETRNLITHDNIDYFTCREVALKLALSAPISGINGITQTFAREDAHTKEWVLDTRGTNLLEIMATHGVDSTKTISDDMWEIYNVLGIEAAKRFLTEELTRIIGFDGTYVNLRHIQILVNSMTLTGTITSVRRDGISRDVGPIAKLMFERAIANGLQSAVYTENDMMNSVSSAVMYGKMPKCGTGIVNIKSANNIVTNPVIIEDEDLDKIEEVALKIKKSKKSKRNKK